MASQKLIQPATDLAVSVDDVKSHLGIVDPVDTATKDAQDAKITALIKAATNFLEDYTERAFLTQRWRITLDGFPYYMHYFHPSAIEVPRPPLQSVDSVSYLDLYGNSLTLDMAGYRVILDEEPALFMPPVNATWPSTAIYQPNAVTVEITAGWASVGDVPEALKLALKLLVGNYWENREAVVAGNVPYQPLPYGVDALVAPYRMTRFVG